MGEGWLAHEAQASLSSRGGKRARTSRSGSGSLEEDAECTARELDPLVTAPVFPIRRAVHTRVAVAGRARGSQDNAQRFIVTWRTDARYARRVPRVSVCERAGERASACASFADCRVSALWASVMFECRCGFTCGTAGAYPFTLPLARYLALKRPPARRLSALSPSKHSARLSVTPSPACRHSRVLPPRERELR